MTPEARFAPTPANRLLGLQLRQRGQGHAVVALPARSELTQEEGVVHGGLLATLLDTAAVYAIHPDLAPGWSMTSISFQVNFLGPGDPAGCELLAEAQVLRRGGSVAVVESTVRQGDRLVGKGSFTYLLRPPRPPTPPPR